MKFVKKESTLKTQDIDAILRKHINEPPDLIERFTVGQGNYVYYAKTNCNEFVVRCSKRSYKKTVCFLNELSNLNIPASKPLFTGSYGAWKYMICTYIKGRDLGLVYDSLSNDDKKNIAYQVAEIQRRASFIPLKANCDWEKWVNSFLDRAEKRISINGYFSVNRVEMLRKEMSYFKKYFRDIVPVPYLDDISTKNLLIYDGNVSGIIDVDWIGYGDTLTFAALTNVALLDMEYDTVYVDFLLKELKADEMQKKAFIFYSLMYCVDFMGERGMVFNDKRIEINEAVINKLNRIYDELFEKLNDYKIKQK